MTLNVRKTFVGQELSGIIDTREELEVAAHALDETIVDDLYGDGPAFSIGATQVAGSPDVTMFHTAITIGSWVWIICRQPDTTDAAGSGTGASEEG